MKGGIPNLTKGCRKTPFCFSTEMFFENLSKLIQRMTLESLLSLRN